MNKPLGLLFGCTPLSLSAAAATFTADQPSAPTAPKMKTLVIRSPFTSKAPAVAAAPVEPVVDNPIISGVVQLGAFHRVVIQGPFDVYELLGGLPHNDLRYVGHRNYIEKILVKSSHDTLYVTLPREKDKRTGRLPTVNGRATLIIRAQDLHDLQYAGSGKLTAIGLRSPFLHVALNNTGPVELRGKKIQLQQLSLHGTGPVDIKEIDSRSLSLLIDGSSPTHLRGKATVQQVEYGGNAHVTFGTISSPHLLVKGRGNAHLKLMGRVDVLEMRLQDNARFNGEHLIARKAFVKTYDQSRADIQVTDYQSTLASDHSNIFYYRKALHHGDYMHRSGAVLQFDDREHDKRHG